MPKQQVDSQQGEEQNADEHIKTIPRDSFLVTHWPKSLDAARREVTHQLGIRSRRSSKLTPQPPEKRRQIIFPHTELIVMHWRRHGFVFVLETVEIDIFKNGFMDFEDRGRFRWIRHLVTDRCAMRYRRRAQPRLGFSLVVLKLRIELPDLRLEVGDFIV